MFRIIGLRQVINNTNNEVVLSKISGFSSLNDDVEYFIKNKTVDYENRNFCRTFLVFSETADLVGYFTLSLKTLFFDDKISKNKRKKIHGITGEITTVPVIIIGQLSKNNHFNNEISGDELLSLAMDMVYKAHNIVGGRVCLIETPSDEGNKKVVDFYINYGFKLLQTDKSDRFLQLYKKL